jgi:hypothetical protein
MFDDLVEIWVCNACEGAEESEPERKERTITAVKFTEGLGLMDGSI